jgi:hypothetical protein
MLRYKRGVADAKRFELEDMLIRPGTYFNPQTEILVVVDDSPEIDRELLDGDESEEAEWVLVSDESPLDETLRDELLERFQAASHAHSTRASADEQDDEEEDEDEDDDLDGNLEVEDQELGSE